MDVRASPTRLRSAVHAALGCLLLAGLGACARPLAGPAATELLARSSPAHLRVASWNVGRNSIFPPGPHAAGTRAASFARVLRAIDPDVLCVNEVFAPYGAGEVARLLDAAVPLDDGRHWQAHGAFDNVVVSRYPLQPGPPATETFGADRPRGHVVARIALPAAQGGGELWAVCAHFQSQPGAAAVAARQRHADAIAAAWREQRAGLPAGTPLVLLGDFNVYASDPARHLETLRTGDIVDEARYGADFAPDWDGTPLADAEPLQNGRGELRLTWSNDSTGFPPGTLDRILYSDAVLEAGRSFVLLTTTLPAATLARAGLEPGDSLRDAASGIADHLPLVVDLARRRPAAP